MTAIDFQIFVELQILLSQVCALLRRRDASLLLSKRYHSFAPLAEGSVITSEIVQFITTYMSDYIP